MDYSRKKTRAGWRGGGGGGGGDVGTHQFYIPHNDVFHAETPTMIYPNK